MTPEELDCVRAAIATGIPMDSGELGRRLLEHIDSRAEEIKRLEDALVEERARRIYPYSMPSWDNLPEEDHTKVMFSGIEDRYGKKSYRSMAREKLRAEGVIR